MEFFFLFVHMHTITNKTIWRMLTHYGNIWGHILRCFKFNKCILHVDFSIRVK